LNQVNLLKSFKIFCKDKPNAVLLLHTDPDDQAQVFSMNNMIKRLQLNNRVIFTGATFHNPASYDKMREIYNLMDVFFLTTSGEGFGIPIIEAMSCKVPCVVTDYTTTQELLIEDGVCGIPVPISAELTGSWNVERGIMDDKAGCEALKKLYDEGELSQEAFENGTNELIDTTQDYIKYQRLLNDAVRGRDIILYTEEVRKLGLELGLTEEEIFGTENAEYNLENQTDDTTEALEAQEKAADDLRKAFNKLIDDIFGTNQC